MAQLVFDMFPLDTAQVFFGMFDVEVVECNHHIQIEKVVALNS